MADEYYNNKIVTTDGDVLMDVTQDTATPETVLEGETFHLRSGAPALGTYRPSDEIEARLRATVGHSNINLFNEKYRQGTSANLTTTTAVTSKTIIPTAIGQKHIFHNFNQDYVYAIYGLNSAGVSELLSGKIVSVSNRLYDSGYIRQFKYVYENNISDLVAYIIMIRKPQTSGGSNWINITPDSIDQNIIMVTEYPVTSDTFVPYQEPTDSLIEIKTRAYLNSTVGHACKNLLNLKNLSSVTRNGVAWTVDPVAGTITANGTATAQSQYGDVRFTLSEGNYYFSGCPSGGDPSTYDLYAWDYTTNSRPKEWDGSTNAPSDFDGTKKQFQVVNNHEYGLTCRVKPGVTVNNLVFKPMVWDGSIADDTFEPYVTPTDSLIETKARAYLNSTVGHACKNLLKITARATTRYNVTFTPDRINGTILATGQCNPPTINQAQYDYAGGLKPIPDSFRQGLILKDDGVIAGTQSMIGFYDDSGTYISGVVCDKTTKSKTVTIPSNATKYKMFVRKLASAGNVDVTFKPMLREASIADDTFEPYQIPTDERVSSTDERVSSLDIAAANVSQYVPDPDEGIYWITIIDHYSTWSNQFDIYISTPNSNDRSYFFGTLEDHPIPEHEVKLPRFHSYKGKAISFGIIAGTTDQVMAISSKPGIFSPSHSTSMWDKIFDVDTFLDFCDVKDGSATNYMHIHLCKDGGIRSQAEYEAYIGS